MKCIINGRLVLPTSIVSDYAIIFEQKIQGIVPVNTINMNDYEVIDAKGNLVAPGLVDIHIHGYLGEDASDGSAEGLKKMAAGIAKNGVTSWCPTTMTMHMDVTKWNGLYGAYGKIVAIIYKKRYNESKVFTREGNL